MVVGPSIGYGKLLSESYDGLLCLLKGIDWLGGDGLLGLLNGNTLLSLLGGDGLTRLDATTLNLASGMVGMALLHVHVEVLRDFKALCVLRAVLDRAEVRALITVDQLTVPS